PADLLPAIEIAISRYSQITALEAEVADMTERFETRKRVDRAKGLLMTKMGLTEPDAFRWIQKTSMDRRLTMREVADAVIEQVGGASGGAAAAPLGHRRGTAEARPRHRGDAGAARRPGARLPGRRLPPSGAGGYGSDIPGRPLRRHRARPGRGGL